MLPAEASPDWWNISYEYRKKITVTNPSGLTASAGYPVYITIDHASLVAAGKSLSSGDDVRILFWNGTSWVELDRKAEGFSDTTWNKSTTKVWFDLQADIAASGSDDNYYVYYSYSGAGTPPTSFSRGSIALNTANVSGEPDASVKVRLENYLFIVTAIACNAHPTGFDLAIGMESCSSSAFATWSGDAIPVITNEQSCEEFGFCTGVAKTLSAINILNNTHYITKQYSTGSLTVMTAPTSGFYNPSGSDEVCLADTDTAGECLVNVVEKDGLMCDGATTAPERRGYLQYGSETDYSTFNDDGWNIWDRLIEWAIYQDLEASTSLGSEEEPNQPPNAPGNLGPTEYIDGGWGDDDTPTLEFTQGDPDVGDTVQYRIQIDDSPGFSSPVVDYTSGLLAQGATSFTVGQAADGGSYTTGGVDQTLDEGEYYWQVMSIDEHGAGGDWAVANGGEVAFRLDTTTEEGGADKERYNTQQDVRVSAGGFPPGATVDVYVVGDYAWEDGDDIPPVPGDTVFARKAFTADIDGNIVNALIWSHPLKVGEYDVVFDANRNGYYDAILDLVDHPNHPGFTVLPTPVGGEVHPIDKATLLTPWLVLVSAIILAGTLALRRLCR